MDTTTGRLVNLNQAEAEGAQRLWDLWLAGALDEMPQFAPVDGDKVTTKPKRKKTSKRKLRSYGCN